MRPVVIAVIQLFTTALAAYGLWRLWRLFESRAGGDRVLIRIAAAGLLLRAIGGQILFWISWLRLPILTRLQLGNGFWFFAIDGYWYLRNATKVLRGELEAFTMNTQYASHTFAEILAVFVALCGSVASVGILLNCVVFVATALVIVRFTSASRAARLAALCTLSLAPGALLWSMQPLKDGLFAFTVIALVAALSAWREERGRRLATVAAMLVCLYVLAGMRWYFAVTVWGFAGLFFLWLALRQDRRRVALAAAAVLFVIGIGVVRLGGAGDMVPVIDHTMQALGRKSSAQSIAGAAPDYVKGVRQGFDNTPGATKIGVGPVTDVANERPPANAPANAVATPPTDAIVPPVVSPTGRLVALSPPAAPVTAPASPAVQPEPRERVAPAEPPAAPVLPEGASPPPVVAEPPTASEGEVTVPRSLVARILAGASATFLPRSLAQALGLVEIRGGRGLWILVEIDTLAFDVLLLFVAGYLFLALRRRQACVTPLFLLVLAVLAVMTAALVYSVSNFGTLFRLRQILFVLVALLPLTLERRPARDDA